MTPQMRYRLRSFREAALAKGIPADDVERWVATGRPCATMMVRGDGPVVGRFGGPLLLPAGTADPLSPFVASVDLAALPADVTDLSLPPDGQLLLFAFPATGYDYECMGSVVYVPAGTAVEERDRFSWNEDDEDEYREMFEDFPQGPMRMTTDVSLPHHYAVEVSKGCAPLPGHPRAEELVDVWESIESGSYPIGKDLQIGGYSDEEAVYTDPLAHAVGWAVKSVEAGRWEGPVSADVEDWVLLADWYCDVRDHESATVHWVIQREDLAARRFDRVFTDVFSNP
ncbi:DUF1963 domain-containing protein [Streptomyces sp. NPDC059092]|uniref:DUF1963 domain-containing protein n=1 Tax=Streptomyces sp. NPDC059092 TaxID=3346725 RepID=UPI0036B420F6